MRHLAIFAASLTALSVVSLSSRAHAQSEPDEGSDRAATTAQDAHEYTAPLYQRTQPSYVPQSIALSGPHTLTDWEPGEPVPAGYHPVQRTRKGMIIGGAVTFGTMYFFSALAAAMGADDSYGHGNEEAALWVPVAGPFIQMGHTSSATGNLFLAVDGAAQGLGLGMLVYGIVSPKQVLIRNDLLGQNKIKVDVAPIVSKDMSGVGLSGRF